MVTHPAPGNRDGTLVNAILFHCPDLKGVGDQKRPGIVHRLDKGTSGVMVVAKTQKCHEGLVDLFSRHDIERRYHALAMGTAALKSGKLESMIGRHPKDRQRMANITTGGKRALTHYKVLHYFHNFSHFELTLETGRTHQIRVHLSSLLAAALIGDTQYGNPAEQKRRLPPAVVEALGDYPYPLLHAKVLGFVHPITKQALRFETELPEIFKRLLLAAGDPQ
jgi:23S rRNA pseudouridine1911/1915/1917 synthase